MQLMDFVPRSRWGRLIGPINPAGLRGGSVDRLLIDAAKFHDFDDGVFDQVVGA